MLSNAEIIKSIGSFMILDYATGLPISFLESIEDLKVTPKTTKSKLSVPRGLLDSSIDMVEYVLAFTAYEYPKTLMERFFGSEAEDLTDDASIEGAVNIVGDTIFDASAPITGCKVLLDVPDVDNLKPGHYVLAAKTGTTLSLYGVTDVAFNEGDKVEFLDDTYLIMDDITIESDASAAITDINDATLGFKLLGGSGTIAFDVDDTAEFRVHRAKTGFDLPIGIANFNFQKCKAIAYPRKQNDIFRHLEIHKFNLEPVEIGMGKDYSKYTISADLEYDSTKGEVFRFRKE